MDLLLSGDMGMDSARWCMYGVHDKGLLEV